MKPCCNQNIGACSPVNDDTDCQNNLVWGGKRKGAGRPSTGRKLQRIYATDDEMTKIREYLEELRK